MKRKNKLSELCYGGVVLALSEDPNVLFLEKCEMVYNTAVQYPELLEIFFEGVNPWIFDIPITTQKEASRHLSAGFPFY